MGKNAKNQDDKYMKNNEFREKMYYLFTLYWSEWKQCKYC